MAEIDEAQIRDWLLHRLDAQRSAEIERRLFVDAGLAERIDAVECDLIDDCARGRLPAAEVRIIQARDAWRVRFAKALAELQRSSMTPAPRVRTLALRRVGFGFALAASVLLVVAIVRWQTAAPTRMAQTVDAASLPVVALLAGQQRGAAIPLALPAWQGDVRLQAEIDDGAAQDASASYTLSVSAMGRVVFVAHDLAPRTAGAYRFVETVVPAAALGPGVHRVGVSLQGGRDVTAASWDVEIPASR